MEGSIEKPSCWKGTSHQKLLRYEHRMWQLSGLKVNELGHKTIQTEPNGIEESGDAIGRVGYLDHYPVHFTFNQDYGHLLTGNHKRELESHSDKVYIKDGYEKGVRKALPSKRYSCCLNSTISLTSHG